MNNLHFVWDPDKNESNRRKHGVGFDEAQSAFYDDFAKIIYDPDHSEGEDRFLLLGLSERLRCLVVCHCYYEDEMSIRIISARKATKREQEQYEG